MKKSRAQSSRARGSWEGLFRGGHTVRAIATAKLAHPPPTPHCPHFQDNSKFITSPNHPQFW